MQEIEGVIDEMHAAFAVGSSLGMGEAWQTGVVYSAEFAVDVGGLYVRDRRYGGRVFSGPGEAGPG